jgi:hypothetical protein
VFQELEAHRIRARVIEGQKNKLIDIVTAELNMATNSNYLNGAVQKMFEKSARPGQIFTGPAGRTMHKFPKHLPGKHLMKKELDETDDDGLAGNNMNNEEEDGAEYYDASEESVEETGEATDTK